jgi:hypothetical protein
VPEVIEEWDVRTMPEIVAPGIEHYYDEREDGIQVAVMPHEAVHGPAAERDGKVIEPVRAAAPPLEPPGRRTRLLDPPH